MDWWSDLWLNEGFASYVEYIGVERVHPEWKIVNLIFYLSKHFNLKVFTR